MGNGVLLFFRVVALSLFSGCSISAQGSALVVPLHDVFEEAFHQAGSYSNPYTKVTATATFTAPDGTEKTVPLFWDGGGSWKVRFSPNALGDWTWITNSNDPGLSGQFGSFDCRNSANRGGIRKNTAHPYHFEYQNGEPFWWFGDTHWTAFADKASENLSRATVLHYIDVRSNQGFNYIHSNLLNGTGEFPGGPTFIHISKETLNPKFFQEVDYRVRYMNAKGITSGLVLGWSYGWDLFISDAARQRYARYVAARYGAYNVAFIVSGEWQKSGLDTEHRYVAIGDELMDNDPHDRMIAIHTSSKYSGASVEHFNGSTKWMSFGDYQQNYDSLHSKMLGSRGHGKPVVNAEYAYYLRDKDGDGVVDKPNSATRRAFRDASYDILMAGGYFVTGFGSTYYGGIRDRGVFNVDHSKNDVAENDLINMRKLFAGTTWWLLQPKDSLLAGPGTHYALAEIGEQYLVYVRKASRAISLSLGSAPSKTYEVKRFDPRTGIWKTLPDYTGTGSVKLTPPDTQDWVFYLDSKS